MIYGNYISYSDLPCCSNQTHVENNNEQQRHSKSAKIKQGIFWNSSGEYFFKVLSKIWKEWIVFSWGE